MKGNFEGLKGYVVGWMTKSRRGKIYIDDEGWGPDAGSIEYGYRVPFGGIHVFIVYIREQPAGGLGQETTHREPGIAYLAPWSSKHQYQPN